MNKWDKFFIALLLAISVGLYATVQSMVIAATSNEKIAIVTYRDREILRIDMSKDGTYVVDGTLGDVFIEVKDNRIRVEKETSPYNICSIQGWVEYANIPITCLPNHIVIMISNAPNQDDEDAGVR